MPGKMLRTTLVTRLGEGGGLSVSSETLARACAAVEMAHTASLCHDDLIDGGAMRRHQMALWKVSSPSSAVLTGDILFCDAVELLAETDDGQYVASFVAKIREMCATEIEQELVLRERELDEQTCLRIARSKTGPLFAFPACVCGGSDHELSAALEEAGYRIGTAYQLADDLLDVSGREDVAGKTLGTDAERSKFTLAHLPNRGPKLVRKHVAILCHSSLNGLDRWPSIREALSQYLSCDLHPVFAQCAQDHAKVAV